jgi:hypothetical protein
MVIMTLAMLGLVIYLLIALTASIILARLDDRNKLTQAEVDEIWGE